MIPYIYLSQFNLGPIVINVWGVMVALGFLAAILVSYYRAKKLGLNQDVMLGMALWIIIGSMIVGRLFHVFLYEPTYYFAHLNEVFHVWQGGMSIFGGFVGSLLFGYIFLQYKNADFWRYAELVIYAMPLGLFIGRIGCFLIHDHPGTPTSFPLGIVYPNGQILHDHGLYLSISGLILFLVFLTLNRLRKPPKYFYLSLFALWYGIVRFLLDFLRYADETRYWGLTPAQYLSIVLIFVGVAGFIFINKKRSGIRHR